MQMQRKYCGSFSTTIQNIAGAALFTFEILPEPYIQDLVGLL
jgi:hypothetical protein